VKWENAFDAFAGFAKDGLVQVQIGEHQLAIDDAAIAPQGNEGQQWCYG
jgi:hypothetical protein